MLEILCHPSYSPDGAPTDYHILEALDSFLQENNLKCEEDAKAAFHDITTACSPEFFTVGINKLPIKYQNYVNNLGAHL